MKREMLANIKMYITELGSAMLWTGIEALLIVTTGVALLFRLIATPFELLAAVVETKAYNK